MSDKRSVPTFRVVTYGSVTAVPETLEGPIVAPDKQFVATDITEVHDILKHHGAVLVYAKQWVYIPLHSVFRVMRGKSRFSLPWPLIDDASDDTNSED